MKHRVWIGCAALGLLLGIGCTDSNRGPTAAPSSSQIGYASGYPAELERIHAESGTQLDVARNVSDGLKEFPSELQDPDWALVEQVYTRADAEGKGQAFAARFEEASVINRFFAEEKQALVTRVAGAVKHKAKEKSCEVDAFGPVSYGLEKGIEKQIEERMRSESDAHLLIDDNDKDLGKQNVEALHAQADKISMASYVVYLRSAFIQNELRALTEQADAVRDTLTEHIEQLKHEKEPDKERIAAVDEAIVKLDKVQPRAEQTLQEAQQQAEAAQKSYEQAFQGLLDKVRSEAEQAKGGSDS